MADANETPPPGKRPVASDEIEFDPPLGGVSEFTLKHPVLSGATERWNRGGGMPGLITMLRVNPDALRLLIKTTMAMAGVPFGVMMLSYHVVLDRLFTFQSNSDKMVWAGVAALCAVQCVIIGFLVTAFREDVDDTPDEAAAAPAQKKDQ